MKSLKSDCGKNFLTALVDGTLAVDFADKKATYTVNGKPFYHDAGSSTQVMGLFVWEKSRSVFVKFIWNKFFGINLSGNEPFSK